MAAAAGGQHVLRVRRVDGDAKDGYIVVQVTRESSQSLDLAFVASESEHVYVGSVRQSGLAKLRTNTFSGTEAEWMIVLERILLQQPINVSEKSLFEGVEAVSTVSDGQINLIVRKNVEGITQRLGSIVFDQNDEEEADFIGWSATAAQAAQDAVAQLSDLQTKFEEQRETIDKLNSQLEELVKAKTEHENDLLQKFTELLNSKKKKIRDQQRLLAGAKVDAETAEQVVSSREAGSSRKGKRKVTAAGAEDSESDAFETAAPSKMEIDKDEEEDEEVVPIVTPEATDDETEDEDEVAPASVKMSTKSEASAQKASASSKKASAEEQMAEIPPRRELPFTRKSTRGQSQAQERETATSSQTQTRSQRGASAAKASAPADDDDETDDEL